MGVGPGTRGDIPKGESFRVHAVGRYVGTVAGVTQGVPTGIGNEERSSKN